MSSSTTDGQPGAARGDGDDADEDTEGHVRSFSVDDKVDQIKDEGDDTEGHVRSF